MVNSKTYCLRCRRMGTGCKCPNELNVIFFSHRLRPPLRIRNKARFRKFLDDCPSFVNMVPERLRSEFRKLLIDVKYFNKTINGMEWTRVDPRDKR